MTPKRIIGLQQNLGKGWSGQPAVESSFGEGWSGVWQDCRYCFPCALDPIVSHFIANMSEKKSLQNLALSKNGVWPHLLWFLCHHFKYLVEVTNSVLSGLGRFHKRVTRVEESQVLDSRGRWRLAHWRGSLRRLLPRCTDRGQIISFSGETKNLHFYVNVS